MLSMVTLTAFCVYSNAEQYFLLRFIYSFTFKRLIVPLSSFWPRELSTINVIVICALADVSAPG